MSRSKGTFTDERAAAYIVAPTRTVFPNRSSRSKELYARAVRCDQQPHLDFYQDQGRQRV